MQFNSIQYFVFLFAVAALYYLLPLKARKLLLLAASFAFYAAWNAKYLLLLVGVIAVTFAAARGMVRSPRRKKLFFVGGLIFVLALLFYFKYLNFAIDTVNALFNSRFAAWDILLPVGISFYVFQSIGYLIDVWQKPEACEESFVNYALFISFFPQLVAGPIERSSNMLGQFNIRQPFRLENLKNGLTLILIGLVQKVVLADRLAVFVNGVFAAYESAGRLTLVLAVVFFAFQMYCDFGAYSLIAIGSARMMGYRLMQNFDRPFLSRSFAEYWSRWHISLSSWFQDYIFEPFVWTSSLAQRKGPHRKPPVHLGLLLVFLLSGFWHGANWTFVIWGLLHAAFRLFETATAKAKKRFYAAHHIQKNNLALAVWQAASVFALNCVTFVFFRAVSVGQAAGYLRQIVTGCETQPLPMDGFGMSRGELLLSGLLIAGLVLCEICGAKHHPHEAADVIIDRGSVVWQSVVYAGLLLLFVVCGTYGADYVENPFIYFQF